MQEANAKSMPAGSVSVQAQGIEAAADAGDVRSPETYIGYSRAEHFASPGGIKPDSEHIYAAPEHPGFNQWGLAENG